MKKLKMIIALFLMAIGAIIVLQNTEAVQTQLLWYSITMPRAILLILTALVGFALGVIVCFSTMKRES
jgi:lipopolysaccharide assembly protein A